MSRSRRIERAPRTTRTQDSRPDFATRSGGMVTFAISLGVLMLTVFAAWTTVGPAA